MIIKINLSNLYTTHTYIYQGRIIIGSDMCKEVVTLGAIGAKMVQDHDGAIAGEGSNGAR